MDNDEPCEQCTHVSAWQASANLEHPVTRGFKLGPLLASPAWLVAARHDQLASTCGGVNTRPLLRISLDRLCMLKIQKVTIHYPGLLSILRTQAAFLQYLCDLFAAIRCSQTSGLVPRCRVDRAD